MNNQNFLRMSGIMAALVGFVAAALIIAIPGPLTGVAAAPLALPGFMVSVAFGVLGLLLIARYRSLK